MFASPMTNAPVTKRTQSMYQTTFAGPIYRDRQLQDAQRNQSMAQASYKGEQRQFNQQQGKGIGAGGKMAAYRSGMLGDAEASKAYAQAQQDTLNRMADSRAAELQFQERLTGERGWVRDLLTDRMDVQSKVAQAGYKEFADVELAEMERHAKRIVNEANRQATIMSALF